MKLIRMAASTLNQTPLDWEGNKANILTALEEAREQQVSILCLPELCISGYGCEDEFLSASVHAISLEVLHEILPSTRGMIVSLGLPVTYNNAVFNAACLLINGQIGGFVGKRHLARSGIHYEPRWFKAWPSGTRVSLRIGKKHYPFGDLYFDCGGVRVAFEICEDAWVADRPGGGMSAKGIDVILNPSASHFAFGKRQVRERFVLQGSRAFGVSYIYSNLIGNEAGRAIYDGGAMIAASGELLASSDRFSFQSVQLVSSIIDLDLTRMGQASSAVSKARLEDDSDCVTVDFSYPDAAPESHTLRPACWENSKYLKEEEFLRALCLGLFDYLRKSRSKGFVVSLSGGADSTAVACLAALTFHLAVSELGMQGVSCRLPFVPGIDALPGPRDLVRRMLTCVYQSTANSSDTTRRAARDVAEALNARYHEFDVEEIVQQYRQIVSAQLGRPLNWDQDDIALQNIQARVRSPGIWMIANIEGALLLSTSNRSEAAVGYATMDGDTSGGLSPIAGIDKAFLLEWLTWLQEEGPDGLRSLPVLSVVTSQQPTAELRPHSHKQTDEEDLMPYPLLDAIERAAIRDKKSPLEVLLVARTRFPEYSLKQLGDWVRRFFELWCRNQWKRERYAPSFHLDDENLDPKTWCRFPILSGGFRRELQELADYLASQPSPEEVDTPS